MACYRRALDLYLVLGDRHLEALIRTRLGDTHQALGNLRAAHEEWLAALAVLGEVDHPEADKVRARLAGPQPTARPRSA
jgi:hypothetical protein